MGHQYKLDIPKLDSLVLGQSAPKSLYSGVTSNHIEWPDTGGGQPENDPGFLSRVIDYASRPFMAGASFTNELINPASKTNPFEAAWDTFKGNNPVTWSDVLKTSDDFYWTNADMPDWLRGTVGFGLDVALDPTNLIPGAVVAKGFEKAAHAVIPHAGLAAVVSHPLKAVDYWARGEHKIDAAIAAGKISPRHTEADITAAGGITNRVQHGDVVESPDLVDVAPNRLPDLNSQEVFAPPYSPSPGQTNVFEPTFTSPNTGYSQALTEAKVAKDPAGVDAVTGNPFVRAPDGQRMTFITTPEGEVSRGTRPIYEHPTPKAEVTPTGMKELPPGSTQLERSTAKAEEAAVGTTGAKERVFEVQPATGKAWDMNANAFDHANELAAATKAARAQQNDASFLHANGINMEGKNSVHWSDQDKAVYNAINQDMRAAKQNDLLNSNAPVTLLGKDRVLLHMSDVMDSIPGKDFMKMHLTRMKPPKGVRFNLPPSSIQHGAAAAVLAKNAGMTGDNLTASIVHAIHDANKTATRISSKHAKDAADVLAANVGKLQHHVVKNEQIVHGTDHAAGLNLGSHVAEEVKKVLDDPLTSQSKELVRTADLYGQINREVRNSDLTVGDSMAAGQRARDGLANRIDDLDVAASRDMLAVAKRVQKGDNTAAKDKLLETYLRDSRAMTEQSAKNANDFAISQNIFRKPGEQASLPPDLFADLADREIDDFLNGFNRMYRSVRSKVVGGSEQGKFFGIRRGAQATAGFMHAQFKHDLDKIYKDFGEEATNQAFNAIHHGANLTQLPKDLQPIVDSLYPKIKNFFDPAGGFIDNAVFRSGVEIPAANAMFKARGLPWLEIKEAYKGEPLAQAWLRHVKDLKIDNPREFMERFHGVAVDASVLSAMARHAEAYGTATARDGFSRIAQSAKFEDAPLSHFINPERYIPDQIIEQLRRANVEMLKPVNWGKSTTTFGKIMNKVYMPLTRIWKTFATVLRPGHHLANIMGDTLINHIAGVGWRDYGKANEALRSIGLVGKQSYEMLDRALFEGMPEFAYKANKGTKHAFESVFKDGSRVAYTNGQVGEQLLKNGALSDFRMLEDMDQMAKSGIDKASNAVLNSRYGRVFEKVSEWNSNLQRSSQAIRYMRDSKFTRKYDNAEEAWKAAIAESLKAHPDSAGLAAWERKWGRALIPFYSYNKQILPWIVTNFAANPGRTLRIPKAQYNMQVAAGNDPTQPGFPVTMPEVLPPWALAMLGGNFMGEDRNPTGMNLGYNLSSPLDTLADWTNQANTGGNPVPPFVKQLGQSINPLATLPFKIFDPSKDKSEVIDAVIPGGTTVTGITGISPTGTVGNVLSGTPAIDPTRQVQMGNRNMIWNEALFNFLTGLRVQDFSDYAGVNQPSVRTSNR